MAAHAEAVVSLVAQDVAFTQSSLTVEDYLAMLRSWVPWSDLSPECQHEFLVLAHWYHLAHDADLLPVCKSIRTLWKAAQLLHLRRDVGVEGATQVETVLRIMHSSDRIPLALGLFAEARQRAVESRKA